MATSAVNGDRAHLHVVVGREVALEPDGETAAEVHVDRAKFEVAGAVDTKAEVGVAGHG